MDEYFKPGDTIRRSGIYVVVHAQECAPPHEVTCVFGEVLPPCLVCGQAPDFKPLKYATEVLNHEKFKA